MNINNIYVFEAIETHVAQQEEQVRERHDPRVVPRSELEELRRLTAMVMEQQAETRGLKAETKELKDENQKLKAEVQSLAVSYENMQTGQFIHLVSFVTVIRVWVNHQ